MVLIVVSNLSEEDNLLDELLEALLVLTDNGIEDEMTSEYEVLLDLPELDIDLKDEIVELEGDIELDKLLELDEAIEPEEVVELEDNAALEETMVAACCEIRTDTMEEATAEVLTGAVEKSALLADLSCGLAE
jgi:hypothetical protein